ncbi:hypothetical protein H072_5514 [Dactylellina haptotyla CBS 200.50]|uniref:Uncharacterized protein n=1 Tax=Dactylellina haptotyla (strain CBS 200.50) TaxID=1284197 RepID=S8ACA1_DACHA|nr:hypothetical protein H072_5514 [Dactylellina haptotyla CBS 200.50]
MNPAMPNSRPSGPLSFSPTPGALTQQSSGVPNSNIAAQQQQQLLMQKAQENQNQLQLDKSRVSLLLEINTELLKESLNLQATKAGAPGTDASEDLKTVEKSYNECMQRLKVNLAYLAAMADRRTASLPASPALLIPPSNIPSLVEPYKKLQALFPGINNGGTTATNAQPGHSRTGSQNTMMNPALKSGMPNQQAQLSHVSPPPPPHQQPQPQQPNAGQHPLGQAQSHPQQSLQSVTLSQNQTGSIAPTMMQNVMQNHLQAGPLQNMNPMAQMAQMSPHQQQQLQQIQQIQQQQALNRQQQQQQNPQIAMHPQQAGQMGINTMNFNPGFYLQQAQMQAQMMRPQQNPRMLAVSNSAGIGSAGMMAPTMNPSIPGIDPMFGSGEMNWNFGMPGNWSMSGGG